MRPGPSTGFRRRCLATFSSVYALRNRRLRFPPTYPTTSYPCQWPISNRRLRRTCALLYPPHTYAVNGEPPHWRLRGSGQMWSPFLPLRRAHSWNARVACPSACPWRSWARSCQSHRRKRFGISFPTFEGSSSDYDTAPNSRSSKRSSRSSRHR